MIYFRATHGAGTMTFMTACKMSPLKCYRAGNKTLDRVSTIETFPHCSGGLDAPSARAFRNRILNVWILALLCASLSWAGPLITINTSPPLAVGMVGVGYSQTLTASNATPPYIFFLTVEAQPNALPPGLSLATNGVLSGTPTVEGSFTFDVSARDQTGATTSAPISVTISPALAITTSSPLAAAPAGASYSQTFAITGGTAPFTFTSTGSIPPGLTLSSTTGVLSGTPTSVGGYAFGVQVTDRNAFKVNRQYQLAIVTATNLLQVSPLKLSFAAFVQGDSSAPQSISIVASGGTQVNYVTSIDGGSPNTPTPSWITVKPLSGTTPAGVTVIANPNGMGVGVYNATIHISVPNNTSQSPIDVQVTLNVAVSTPIVEVSPTSLSLSARAQTPSTQDQIVVLRNSGGGGALSYSVSVVGKSSWITSVTPASGQVSASSPVFVHLLVNSQGLGNGSFHDILRITTSAGILDVPVTLFISSQGSILGLTTDGLRFDIRQGSGSSRPEVIDIVNLGDLSAPLNPTVEILSGSDWLQIAKTDSAPGSFVASTLTLTASGSASTLPVGGSYALVRVSDSNATNSPQYLSVVLAVQPAATPAAPDPSPEGLFFTSTTAAQNVTVYSTSTTPVAYQASATTADGGTWLSVSPSSGVASTQNPGGVSVKINPTGMQSGIYTGNVNLSISGILRSVNVTFVIPPASSSAVSNPGSPKQLAAGCTPVGLAITQTGIVNNFSVPAGWPASVIVQLNDDCGNAITNGSVVASFSNGDAPLTLRGDKTTNVYSATWQPGVVTSSVGITVRAAAGVLPPAVAQFEGGVNANATPPPTLIPGGTLHIFFDVPTANALGFGLAPGNVAQVYGTGMASVAGSPGVLPLVGQFNGTFLLIGGIQAPLYYVSSDLIDVQIPAELVPNRQYAAILSANGALTLPETLTLVPAQPGMAVFADGTVIAQHVLDNYSLVTSAHPAKPGEPLVIYLAGMGATDPAVASGKQTPNQFVPATVQPTMTLDGQHVDIGYAGLTPSGVGLYQINFTVPANARSGSLELIVTQSGTSANTTKLPVSN